MAKKTKKNKPTLRTCRLYTDVTFDVNVTDSEAVSSAMDVLVDTARSTPSILDEYGDPQVGGFYVLKEDVSTNEPDLKAAITSMGRAVDWKLLYQQQVALIGIHDRVRRVGRSDAEVTALQGILGFLESLTDAAGELGLITEADREQSFNS